MSSQTLVKNPVVRLLSSSAVIVGSTVYGVATGDVLISSSLIIKNVLDVLNTIAPEIFGGAFEEKFVNSEQRNEILQNGDLSRAVGKAIFILILEESTKDGYTIGKDIIKTVGNSKPKDWEDFVITEFNKEDDNEQLYVELQKILPGQLTQYFAEKESELENVKSLTPEIWAEIIKRLFLSHTYRLYKEDCEKLGEIFYNKFPNALRKVLIADFSSDGKAFASLQLRIVGEILSYIKDTHKISQQILNIVVKIDEKIDTIINDFSGKKEIVDENYWSNQRDSLNDLVFNQLTQIIIAKETLDESKKQTGFLEKLVELAEKIVEERNSAQETKLSIPKYLGAVPKLNPYFTGREDVLKGIAKQLSKIAEASLFGLHGLGKTQTALKFAKENQQNYAHIIFVNAAKDLFLNSMAQFANIFDLNWQNSDVQGREISDDEKKCDAVKKFLENDAIWSREKRRFLLIFDNVDEPEQVKPFVPDKNQGDLLFTSNSKFIKNRAPLVEIPSMDEKDAKLLLYRRGTGRMSLEYEEIPAEKHKVLEEIAENLAYLPVLLENAAVTIDESTLKFETFLEKLKNSPTIALEKEYAEVDYQYKNAKNGFSISFELMTTPKSEDDEEKSIAEAVKEVLFTCSVLASTNIPEILLRVYVWKLVNHLSEAVKNDDFWEKVRTRLTRFDLLDYDREKASFDMHRFVQYVIWNHLIDKNPGNNKQIAILKITIAALDELFDFSEHETKENCELYTPHAVVLVEKAEKSNLFSEEIASTNDKIGRHLRETVKYQNSIAYFQKAIDFYKTLPEKEQTNLANCLNELGLVYYAQGKYNEAIEKYEEALRIDEKTIGKEYPDHANRLNNLAVVYRAQGRYDAAIEKYEEVLRIDEKTIGKEHPNYAVHLNNLALVYEKQLRFEAAIEKFEEVLRIDEKTIGKKHPNYAIDLNNLGEVYRAQGKYDEAIKKYQEALHIAETTIGKEHPSYAIYINNLALVYDSQGRYDVAIENYEEAVQIFVNFLGENHPSTQTVKRNLEICRSFAGKE